MNAYSFRLLKSQPLKLGLTVGGIALCIVLMLFLLSVYHGVREGSVEYISKNEADLWVLQRNAWNILRGSSLLTDYHRKSLENISEIESVSPILLLLSGLSKNGETSTVFLTGYNLKDPLGGPPLIIEGNPVKTDDDIVLDVAFAKKMNYNLGDKVKINDKILTLVGKSSGTNALVIQYAFVTLSCAQKLIGFPGIVTCFALKLNDGIPTKEAIEKIKDNIPGIEVYDHETFLSNNIKEMETGFLPFLSIIAILGTIVLTIILSLLLSINILEQRKDFAVLKVLGSPNKFLPNLVIGQAMIISSISCFVALILFFPIVTGIESLVPELSTKSTADQIIIVVIAVWFVSLVSSLISANKIRKIYPLEVFQ